MPDLTIAIFSSEAEYDFSDFDCGEESLNVFLTDHLARQHNARILRGYLLITQTPKPKVVITRYLVAASKRKHFRQIPRNEKCLMSTYPVSL